MDTLKSTEQYYTGALQSPKDDRDYIYSNIARTSAPYDWGFEFDIEDKVGKIKTLDQGNTSACGGYAWGYLSYVLDKTKREDKSPYFIYAHTNAPGGGSTGRANCELCRSKGVASITTCPLPEPLTEGKMIDKRGITDEAYKDALTNKAKTYLSVIPTIDNVAQAVRDNDGAILLVRGQNNGTWRSLYPQVPSVTTGLWGHWLYAGKIKMINGKKHIGVMNSWGNVGDNGWQWIAEDYFKHPFISECWVMTYDEQLAPKFVFNRVLRRGSRGLDVRMLQTMLGIGSDGIFGAITDRAVRDFQRKNNLTVDGIVGRKTLAVLTK